jgi:hypothetical protein
MLGRRSSADCRRTDSVFSPQASEGSRRYLRNVLTYESVRRSIHVVKSSRFVLMRRRAGRLPMPPPRTAPGASALARDILEKWGADGIKSESQESVRRAGDYLKSHLDGWDDDPAEFFPGISKEQ